MIAEKGIMYNELRITVLSHLTRCLPFEHGDNTQRLASPPGTTARNPLQETHAVIGSLTASSTVSLTETWLTGRVVDRALGALLIARGNPGG